jgi:hypothetical protein
MMPTGAHQMKALFVFSNIQPADPEENSEYKRNVPRSPKKEGHLMLYYQQQMALQ